MGTNLRPVETHQNWTGTGEGEELRGGVHLLKALLETDGRDISRGLQDLGRSARIRDLRDMYALYAQVAPGHLASLLHSGRIQRALTMPRPSARAQGGADRYAEAQSFDLEGSSRLERFLRRHPFERQQLEMALGGRILPSPLGNGRLRVQPFQSGGFPAGGLENDAASTAQAMLGNLSRAAGPLGAGLPVQSMFQGMMLGALAQMLGGGRVLQNGRSGGETLEAIRRQGRSPFVDWSEDSPEMARRRALRGANGNRGSALAALFGGLGNGSGGDALASLFGGLGNGGFDPAQYLGGNPGPYAGLFGLGGDDPSSVMNDGALTVEDKVTLMLMLIMKKMDQDIERQANYINALQQQQNGGGGGGKGGKGGGKGGGGAGGGAPSIDVETMKLKRLIDKRSQMFDMLRQIIDKYNQTAKGIIDSMGRQ